MITRWELRLTCILTLFFMGAWVSLAQTESEFWSTVPEQVHLRYAEASNSFDQDWVLGFADTLESMGQSKGRKEFSFFAEELRCHHAFNMRDSLGFFPSSEKVRDYAQKLGWYDKYFAEMVNLVSFYINSGDSYRSQKTASQLLDEAMVQQNKSGIFFGHYTLGMLYYNHREWKKSLEHFFQSLDFSDAESDNGKPLVSQVYSFLASNYLELDEYDKTLEYSKLALDTWGGTDDALAYRALAHFYQEDYKAFLKDYAEYKTVGDESTSISYGYYSYVFEALKKAIERKPSEALSLCSVFDDSYDKFHLYSDIYRVQGDWENAFKYQQLAYELLSDDNSENFSEEIGMMEQEIADMIVQKNQDEAKIKIHFIYVIIALVILAVMCILLVYLMRNRQVITAQRKALELSQTYQTLVDNAPFSYSKAALIFAEDGSVKDYRTVVANKTVLDSVKAHGAKIGTKTILEAYPKSGPYIISRINEARSQGKPYTRFTFHLEEFDQYYENIILLDGSEFMQVISLNTTDLVKAKKDAEKASKIKTQFIQNMSHEIRTPLNAVVGFSQLLAYGGDAISDEERSSYIKHIENNTSMLVMLIDDILDISDSENGNYRINLSDAPCNEICRSAMRTAESRLQEGVEMKFTSEVDDAYVLNTDPRRVQQVLVNYLTNACKYTGRGFIHLHCSTTENPGAVTFSVADTGAGVPEEMAEDIFERFSKLDIFKQGAGLGLNICSTIADKLGGVVKLDTSYKDGARFVFILPNS